MGNKQIQAIINKKFEGGCLTDEEIRFYADTVPPLSALSIYQFPPCDIWFSYIRNLHKTTNVLNLMDDNGSPPDKTLIERAESSGIPKEPYRKRDLIGFYHLFSIPMQPDCRHIEFNITGDININILKQPFIIRLCHTSRATEQEGRNPFVQEELDKIITINKENMSALEAIKYISYVDKVPDEKSSQTFLGVLMLQCIEFSEPDCCGKQAFTSFDVAIDSNVKPVGLYKHALNKDFETKSLKIHSYLYDEFHEKTCKHIGQGFNYALRYEQYKAEELKTDADQKPL